MRENKFRGKRTVDGEWIYGDLITETNVDFVIKSTFIHLRLSTIDFTENSLGSIICLHEVDPETVGQYTGLQDRNGKGIYEGEICLGRREEEDVTYEILWMPHCAKFGAKVIKSNYVLSKNLSFPLQHYIKDGTMECVFEIIGNIHDNPELLEAS